MTRSRPTGHLAVLALLAIGVAACQTGTGTGTPPAEPTNPDLASPTQAVPSEPLTFTISPEPLLPADYASAVMAGVEDGRWSLEDGLVAALSSAAGLGTPIPDVSRVASREATALVRLARNFLSTQPSAPRSTEIARLLSVLVPSPATLERYAIPEGSQASRPAGHTRPRSEVDCRELAFRGFPEDEAWPCLLYRSLNAHGDEYRIYYPEGWAPSQPYRAYLDLAAEAIRESVARYSAHGEMGPANLFFALLTAEEDTDPGQDLADAVADPAEDGSCQVVVYPDPLARGIDPGDFKQLIAHEFFHCFEFDNLTAQENGPHPKANEWWVEGAAEYFSNIVYPTNNIEHEWLPDFVRRSESTSLVDMKYETYLFFQFLENRQGIEGVLRLLEAMPTSGARAEQLSALAAYPDMDLLFHEFARAFLDNQVRDSSGRVVEIANEAHLGQAVVVEGPLSFAADPFVLQRARLAFIPGKRYEALRLEVRGGDGLHASRPTDLASTWPGLPESLEPSCPAPLYLLTLSNGSDSAGPLEVALSAAITGEIASDLKECQDPCLIGDWELLPESYRTYFDAVSPDTNQMSLMGVEGGYTLSFSDDGLASGAMRAFTTRFLRRDEPRDMFITITMNGTGQGTYWATGSALLSSGGEYDFTTTGSIEVGGIAIPLDPLDFRDSALGAGPPTFVGSYLCTDNILHYTPPLPGQPVGLLQFQRVRR